mmetsp:Transcript_14775/g.40599  ORF Transcript_14775/g.40599 Transcript_14775/m.40599 type:complete len:200 (+) Transcript_14775:282-881(+)
MDHCQRDWLRTARTLSPNCSTMAPRTSSHRSLWSLVMDNRLVPRSSEESSASLKHRGRVGKSVGKCCTHALKPRRSPPRSTSSCKTVSRVQMAALESRSGSPRMPRTRSPVSNRGSGTLINTVPAEIPSLTKSPRPLATEFLRRRRDSTKPPADVKATGTGTGLSSCVLQNATAAAPSKAAPARTTLESASTTSGGSDN